MSEWIGLSEEEVALIWHDMGARPKINGYDFAKVIEEKLKERNAMSNAGKLMNNEEWQEKYTKMSDYNPDRWVMLKFNHNGNVIHKILATFYGGYTTGDSWKLNSGVTKIEEDGQCYLFHGSSGSVYRCHKNAYGMGSYTYGIYASFRKQVDEAEGVEMELMEPETNFMEIDYE